MLVEIVYMYNNTVYRTIKMKPIDITHDSYAEYNKDFNRKDPKFKIGDHDRIPKYKNVFTEGYAPIGQKKICLLVKLKIKFLGLM